jgi:thymidylate kinase
MSTSKYTVQLIRDVIDFLNENVEYAVMRNFDELPDSNSARDIDIIIRKGDLARVLPNVVKTISDTGWSIITYLNSDRLYTLVCARNDGNETSIMQWDFFVDTSVFGIQLMTADEFLANKEFNGFLWHLNVASQFLDKYLYDRAVGAAYPNKYASIKVAAKELPEVKAKIKALFGCDSVEKCDEANGRKLLFAASCYNFHKRPFGLICGIVNFVSTFAGNYIMSRTGFSIGFTGPDGSGKTTVIDRTIERLGTVFATAHAYYHFRPALFGNLGDVAHSAGIKKNVDRNYSEPHRGSKTGVLSSLARLIYYSVDYIIGYFAKIKSQTRITRLVIFDRYYTDIICDSRRSRIYLPPKFLNLWQKLFIPSLDYNILLTASSETILSRKRELDEADIRAINARIDYLSTQHGYIKVLNESTPDDTVTTILNHIFSAQHKKNLIRLK